MVGKRGGRLKWYLKKIGGMIGREILGREAYVNVLCSWAEIPLAGRIGWCLQVTYLVRSLSPQPSPLIFVT